MADKTLRIAYEDDPEQETLLRLQPISLRAYFDIVRRYDELGGEDISIEDITSLLRDFGDLVLVSWTYPEPATGEGFLERDYAYCRALIRDWIRGMRDVDSPLPVGSSATAASPERSTPKRAGRSGRRSSSNAPSS